MPLMIFGPGARGNRLNGRGSVGGQPRNAARRDRSLKQNLVALDGRAVLERLSVLPIYQWQPKDAAIEVRHYGPMAQDFHAAFGLGDDVKRIGMQDADGVALAAIQGRNAKLEATVAEQARENARLRAELADLRSLKAEVASIRAAQSRDSLARR